MGILQQWLIIAGGARRDWILAQEFVQVLTRLVVDGLQG